MNTRIEWRCNSQFPSLDARINANRSATIEDIQKAARSPLLWQCWARYSVNRPTVWLEAGWLNTAWRFSWHVFCWSSSWNLMIAGRRCVSSVWCSSNWLKAFRTAAEELHTQAYGGVLRGCIGGPPKHWQLTLQQSTLILHMGPWVRHHQTSSQ